MDPIRCFFNSPIRLVILSLTPATIMLVLELMQAISKFAFLIY